MSGALCKRCILKSAYEGWNRTFSFLLHNWRAHKHLQVTILLYGVLHSFYINIKRASLIELSRWIKWHGQTPFKGLSSEQKSHHQVWDTATSTLFINGAEERHTQEQPTYARRLQKEVAEKRWEQWCLFTPWNRLKPIVWVGRNRFSFMDLYFSFLKFVNLIPILAVQALCVCGVALFIKKPIPLFHSHTWCYRLFNWRWLEINFIPTREKEWLLMLLLDLHYLVSKCGAGWTWGDLPVRKYMCAE